MPAPAKGRPAAPPRGPSGPRVYHLWKRGGWSRDTLQSDETDRARALLRSMIVRLGEAAVGGLVDPRDALGPLVDVALAARREVRAAKRYDLSDQIRDGLAEAGIEVRDTAEGQVWELVSPD